MDSNRIPNFQDADGEEYCSARQVYEERRLKEASDDFILPDWLPDVRKVVAVFPSAQIKERFLGSGTLEYEGEAGYKVLYIADDRTLKTAQFATGFEDKIGCEDLTLECVDVIEPLCEGVNVRMLNPRRLNVRSMCGADVRVYRRHSALPALFGAASAEDEALLQCDVERIPAANVLDLRENGLTVSEDLSFEASAPTADELLFKHAVPVVQDCRVAEGEAQLRGKIQLLCAFSAGGDGTEGPFFANFQIPFSQTVKNEALHGGGCGFARIDPEGCEVRLREDEFGQRRVVEFDMTYLCDLTVLYPKNVTVVKDLFSLEKETEPTAVKTTFLVSPAALRGSFSVNESVSLDLPEEGGFTLVRPFLTPELRLADAPDKEGNAVLEGSCRIDLLLRDPAGAPDVRRTVLPLRFRTAEKAPAAAEARVSASVSDARLRLDRNKLQCDLEIAFCGQMLGKEEREVLSEVRILPEKRQTPGKRGSVVICFPEKGEPLFSLAKRYSVPVSELSGGAEKPAAGNDRASARASGEPLFIFRK